MGREAGPAFIRVSIPFVLSGAGLSGTGALTLINALAPRYRLYLEKLVLITMDTLVGAGGSQTYKLRKGAAAGTVVATAVLTVASHATIGTILEAAVSETDVNARIVDGATDTLSLTRDASGTAFSAGLVQGLIVARQLPQSRK